MGCVCVRSGRSVFCVLAVLLGMHHRPYIILLGLGQMILACVRNNFILHDIYLNGQ